jgi:hypothetical protein
MKKFIALLILALAAIAGSTWLFLVLFFGGTAGKVLVIGSCTVALIFWALEEG